MNFKNTVAIFIILISCNIANTTNCAAAKGAITTDQALFNKFDAMYSNKDLLLKNLKSFYALTRILSSSKDAELKTLINTAANNILKEQPELAKRVRNLIDENPDLIGNKTPQQKDALISSLTFDINAPVTDKENTLLMQATWLEANKNLKGLTQKVLDLGGNPNLTNTLGHSAKTYANVALGTLLEEAAKTYPQTNDKQAFLESLNKLLGNK